MYENVEDMGDIPLALRERQRASTCGDVATPRDANYIQTNVVRVNGKREVYIPVYRQLGASTLKVVTTLSGSLKEIEERADPSRHQPEARHGPVGLRADSRSRRWCRKGVLGAMLCSLVILMFLGEMADDGDRDHDAADLGPGLVALPLFHRPDDQRDDAGRA